MKGGITWFGRRTFGVTQGFSLRWRQVCWRCHFADLKERAQWESDEKGAGVG